MLFDRYKTAVHEAGHAVIAHQLGFPVEKIFVGRSERRGHILANLTDLAERDRAISLKRGRIFVAMSGWAATRAFGLEKKDFIECRDCRGDWRLIERFGIDVNDCLFMQPTVLNLVGEIRARTQIEKISSQLETNNVLDRSQFLEIINSCN